MNDEQFSPDLKISVFAFKSSRHVHCCHELIMVFAVLAPERTTARTIPGTGEEKSVYVCQYIKIKIKMFKITTTIKLF